MVRRVLWYWTAIKCWAQASRSCLFVFFFFFPVHLLIANKLHGNLKEEAALECGQSCPMLTGWWKQPSWCRVPSNHQPSVFSHRQPRKPWHFRVLPTNQKPSWNTWPTRCIFPLGYQRQLHYSFQAWAEKTSVEPETYTGGWNLLTSSK